jgi:hypothetical protein
MIFSNVLNNLNFKIRYSVLALVWLDMILRVARLVLGLERYTSTAFA